MYYLRACNRDLFQRYYYYVLFLPFEKSFTCYKKNFEFHFYIFFKLISLLRNIRNKCFLRKIDLCFLDFKKKVCISHFLQNVLIET